jgi:hypothetical protein
VKASPNTAKQKPAPPLASQPWSARRVALAAGCIFVFAVLLYLPALRNGFVWDDGALIESPDTRTLNWRTVGGCSAITGNARSEQRALPTPTILSIPGLPVVQLNRRLYLTNLV